MPISRVLGDVRTSCPSYRVSQSHRKEETCGEQFTTEFDHDVLCASPYVARREHRVEWKGTCRSRLAKAGSHGVSQRTVQRISGGSVRTGRLRDRRNHRRSGEPDVSRRCRLVGSYFTGPVPSIRIRVPRSVFGRSCRRQTLRNRLTRSIPRVTRSPQKHPPRRLLPFFTNVRRLTKKGQNRSLSKHPLAVLQNRL